jgi:integrase
MPKLTKRTVDGAAVQDRDYVLWDEALPRFGLRVRSSGTRTYVVQYRSNGRTRHLTIGRHGVLTPDEARREALQILAEVEKGRDPSRERAAARRASTVAELCERYLEDHVRARKKPRSASEDRRLIDKFVLKALGSRKIAEVERADIYRIRTRLSGTPYQANRVLALLSKMFNLAERWSLRPDGTNPVRHVERFVERKRDRFLSEEELARLGRALHELGRSGRVSSAAIAAIRLLIFTGCRVSEILTLRWEDVDFDRRCLRLTDSKTGPKRVPLNAPATGILAELDPHGCPWVIRGRRPGSPLVNLAKPWQRICEKAKLENARVHDLRHSFASVAAGSGQTLLVIGALLGHTQAATTHRYAHLSDDPVRAASEAIGERIAAAMAGKGGTLTRLSDRR